MRLKATDNSKLGRELGLLDATTFVIGSMISNSAPAGSDKSPTGYAKRLAGNGSKARVEFEGFWVRRHIGVINQK